jgi:arylsulfatase A-like enzyme/Tfp pilus assembly protein PilF
MDFGMFVAYQSALRRLLTAIALVFFLSSTSSSAAPPNIILITLDTTRADRMGFLGSTLGLTPNLDQLAKRGTIFTRAYAVVPLTTASHATILTGIYPELSGVNDFGKPLPSQIPYLPDLLRSSGYQTAAFVGSLVLDPVGGTAPGFDRGFDTYDAGFRIRRRNEDRYQTLERRGGDVVAHAIDWLAHRPSKSKPFFLWVHLYDAHDPYDPPAPYNTKFVKAPYDGEVAYVDACVGKLLNALRAQALFENSLIAVMADHGEALGQHGEETHGIFLYDETVHVPLLFKMPAASAAKQAPAADSKSASPIPPAHRIETRVSLADITPTILEIAGQPVPEVTQGHSLAKLISSPSTKTADSPAYSETDYPHRAFGWSSLRSLRSGKFLFIEAPQQELYDQLADPAAAQNLAAKSPAVAETLSSQVTAFHEKLGSTHPAPATATDAQQAEQLSALGYVATDTAPQSNANSISAAPTGVDPKQRIETANLMHDALMEVEDGRYEEAVPHLQRVLATEPQMAVAEMQLGIAYSRLKKPAEALPLLSAAVKRQPDSGIAHYEYGLALFDSGDLQSAAPEFATAVSHAPRWADAHFSLASVYARIDRVPEAMTELETSLALNPNHYRANLLRGRILSLQGHAAEALDNLLKATQVEPQSVEAHAFLADAYTQLNRPDDAARERATANQLRSTPHP